MKVTERNPGELGGERLNRTVDESAQPELARKNAKRTRKCDLLRIAAHDLRNPISGILSASEYLLEDLPDAREEHVALLQAILASSQFMLQLLDEIVEMAALESGGLQFHFQPADLVTLVRQDVALNRLIAEHKRVRMDLIAHGQPLLISADPRKIYQVIDKLVTNAIKFSRPDSSIEIEVGAEADRAILSVRDHGVGIPAEELRTMPRRFEYSHKLDPLRPPAPVRGLSVVRRIVEEHGGEIRLESELGEGSTFTVRLPLTQELPSGGRPRILAALGRH
jgi:signal transduction histidine kinase